MKQKIKVIDNTTKNKTIIEDTVTLRDLDHLEAQIKYKAHVFKPKKGKGSFKRTRKIDLDN